MSLPLKKWIVRSVVLLGINIVVFILSGSAFFVYLFNDDPILAAVPAMLALPVILLQPWSIVFFVASVPIPMGIFLAPFLTTAASIWLWMTLDRAGKLERVKPLVVRLKNRTTLVLIGGFVFWLCVIGVARYIDFPPLHRGTPPDNVLPVKDLRIDLGNPRYYCVCQFFDFEYLVRATISEPDLLVLADKLKMRPIPLNQVTDTFWKWRPYWWRPVRSEQVKCLATENNRSSNYMAVWNPRDGLMHLWIINNFD